MPATGLNIGDYGIIAAYFVLIIVIGIVWRKRMVTSSQYFQLAGRCPQSSPESPLSRPTPGRFGAKQVSIFWP